MHYELYSLNFLPFSFPYVSYVNARLQRNKIIIKFFVCGFFLFVVHSPPKIIKQPPSDELLYQVALQANENDKPFLIECEAEGEPAPK